MSKQYAIREDVAFGVVIKGKAFKKWFLAHGSNSGPNLFYTRKDARTFKQNLKLNGFPNCRVVMVALKYRDLNQPIKK